MNSFLLYLKLAWRNVWRHKRRTVIVLLAIGLGMMMMMFYDGLIAGFDQAIYGNAVRVLGGNITVHAAGMARRLVKSRSSRSRMTPPLRRLFKNNPTW